MSDVVVILSIVNLVIVVSMIYTALSRRRGVKKVENTSIEKSEVITENVQKLSGDEIKILQYLISKDGEAFQSELYRNLGIPKSTVVRILRRLVDQGLVRVERRGKYNYVYTTDKDYINSLLKKWSESSTQYV